MKNSMIAFIFCVCHSLVWSQTKNPTIPFIANMSIDWDNGSVSKERFFSVLIPSSFDYDSIYSNATGYFKNDFFQMHSEVHFDEEEFLNKVMESGKYDLVKYARAMTKEHFSMNDSCTISGVKSENVRTINGVSILKIMYAAKETFMGHESSKKYILFLIPQYPKDPAAFDTKHQMMIFLSFSCFSNTNDKSFNLFSEQVVSTLKPL